jgi:hypothetical protein
LDGKEGGQLVQHLGQAQRADASAAGLGDGDGDAGDEAGDSGGSDVAVHHVLDDRAQTGQAVGILGEREQVAGGEARGPRGGAIVVGADEAAEERGVDCGRDGGVEIEIEVGGRRTPRVEGDEGGDAGLCGWRQRRAFKDTRSASEVATER